MPFRLRHATDEDAIAIADLFFASYRLLTFFPMLHTIEEYRRFVAGVMLKECAVAVGAQCLRRGRRGNASFGICGRCAAAGTKLDTEIIIEQLIVILAGGKIIGCLSDAACF